MGILSPSPEEPQTTRSSFHAHPGPKFKAQKSSESVKWCSCLRGPPSEERKLRILTGGKRTKGLVNDLSHQEMSKLPEMPRRLLAPAAPFPPAA